MNPQPRPLRTLLIEDSLDDALLLVRTLERGGYAPSWQRVETEEELRRALCEAEWDVVFCDYSMPLFDAPNALRVIRESGDALTTIVVSGQVGEEMAVEAMRLGANDFVLKHNLARVAPAVEREMRSAALRKERQETAVALRQSEERYRVLFDQSPWPMWVYDLETLRYLAVNETALKIYGYSREEYLAMTILEMRPAEDVPALLEYFEKLKREGAALPERTWRHRKKDGSVIEVEIAHQPISFNGRPASVVQAIDITARRQAEADLRASESRLQQAFNVQKSLFDALPAHVALVDGNGVILAVNAAWKRFGAENTLSHCNSCIGENYLEACLRAEGTCSEEARAVASGLQAVLRREQAGFACEYPCHSPEEQRWFRLWITPLQGGPDTGAVVLHIDISERVTAELALRDSEERFRQMAENSADVIWMSDSAKGQMLYVSPAYERIWGRTCESLYARPTSFLEAVHPQDRERVAAAFPVQADGKFDITFRVAHPDGTIRWLRSRGYPIRNAAGEIYRLAGIGTDITEAKQAEEQIHEQAALLDTARDAILVQDLEGRVLYWNKSAERVFGWSAAEAFGSRVQELLYENPAAYEPLLERTLGEGGWAGEISKRTKAGSEVLIEGRWTLVRDEAGLPKSILAINTDITERKKIEAQFFRAQRMESIGALAGGIAHDLNNVLGPIIMAVDLLKASVTDQRGRDLLEIMDASGQRGADMVRQVLFFARGMEGQRVLTSPVRLFEELEHIVRDTFPKSIAIEVSAPAQIWNLLCDRTQLHQVLLNLCVNARDAMPRGGRLAISAQNRLLDESFAAMHPEARPGPYILFEVADTGEGMTKEVAGRIFEPFFTTKALGQGTGLGLSTTCAIVRNHGGFISVESEPGAGTVFQVNLPAESGTAEMRTVAAELPRGAGELILIIEDEAAIRSISGQTLEAYGYRIMSAGDGAEGVATYARHANEIAAVLTDMMMPIMDGSATIRVLRRLNPAVKIIAASGLGSKAAEAEAAGVEARNSLLKPYTAQTLLQTLSNLLHAEGDGRE